MSKEPLFGKGDSGKTMKTQQAVSGLSSVGFRTSPIKKQLFTEIERMKLTLIQMYPYVESKDISDIVDRVVEWIK